MPRPSLLEPIELVTPNQCDIRFALREGTAIAACRAGLVKCRPCRARGGKPSFKVDLADARRLWGCA